MRLLLLAILILNVHPAPAALFSDKERARSVAYWNAPGRYRIEARAEAAKNGHWVVRLTPAASLWFYNYTRARGAAKTPPTETTVTPASPQATVWETWITAKYAHDSWLAQTAAAAANSPITNASTGSSPVPVVPAPPLPGLIPLDLLAAVGNPPPFVAAVAPRRYTVTFDDGTAISYTDHVNVRPRYAYYRFDQGVMHAGVALRTIPEEELNRIFAASGMTPFEQHVVKAVSRLEGGFASVNTYDTGYLSVGFIQFATLSAGSGSLGSVLKREKLDRYVDFNEDFRRYGIDVNDAGALVVVDPATGAELAGPEAVLKIIDDKRLTAVFQRAGANSQAFRAAQVLVARQQYYPADMPLSVTIGGRTISGKVADVIKSEAGMATLFDRKVNTGNIRALSGVVAQVMQERGLTKLEEAAAFERQIVRALKYRVDFLADKTLTQPPP